MPLPAGYTLETPAPSPAAPKLPPGYTLEQAPQTSAPTSPAPAPAQPTATIGPAPQPHGLGERISQWADNVIADIKDGGDRTGVGTVLQKMGAHGVNIGSPEAVGNFMASLPLGLARMAKGAGETITSPTSPEAAKDVLGGLSEASTIPSAFAAPPGVSGALAEGAEAASRIIPSATRAGKNFDKVMELAHNLPIDIRGPADALARAEQIEATGGGPVPSVMKKFGVRIAQTDPVTYKEARDFYSNATGKIAPGESMNLTNKMRAALADFTARLGAANAQTADEVGRLAEYQSAMSEFHRAMNLKETATKAAKAGGKAALAGAGLAGGYRAVQTAREVFGQ